jgi:transcriptional regulator with XRE-family HTH domain
VKERVTEKIRKLRESKRMSQENVADELGVTHSTYAKIERGEIDPNITRLVQLAKIFGIETAEFFTSEKSGAFKDGKGVYGSVTKDDIEKLNQSIQMLYSEITKLRSELSDKRKTVQKKEKRG